eukprot:3219826-Rhodomonas_salina.1
MDQTSVSELLAWHTVHGGRVEHYFEAGQAARLREEPGTVVCTDCSVHLEMLDNSHIRASLGAGITYRAHDGVDKGEGVTGRADAYCDQAEGQAAILGIDENPGQLALGMNNLSYLKGLRSTAVKQGIDREWHETDYDGLLYEDLTEEQSWYRPGPRAKKLVRQLSAQYEVQLCKDSFTSNWLLCKDQGRGRGRGKGKGRGSGATDHAGQLAACRRGAAD